MDVCVILLVDITVILTVQVTCLTICCVCELILSSTYTTCTTFQLVPLYDLIPLYPSPEGCPGTDGISWTWEWLSHVRDNLRHLKWSYDMAMH